MQVLYMLYFYCRDDAKYKGLVENLHHHTTRLHRPVRMESELDSENHAVIRFEAERTRDTDRHQLSGSIAPVIAEYMVGAMEEMFLRSLLLREYPDEARGNLNKILSFCEKYGASDADSCGRELKAVRVKVLAEEIKRYMAENDRLDFEGFLRFRAREYQDELRDMMAYGMDEFIMDRQYQEFISLLKYFVYIQEAKLNKVHLIHVSDSDFLMLNENLQPIEHHKAERIQFDLPDGEIQYEDMIVSTLINVSPLHLHIHTREPDAAIIQAIRQIFDERVQICDECGVCKSVMETDRQKTWHP